jgi:hypothetical protein
MSEHKLVTLEDVARLAAAGHSAFSPSSSKMWLTCSGSLIPNLLAHDDCSEEAAEGTVAHSVGEEWLRTGKRPKHLIGSTVHCEGWDIEITEEMMAYVSDYVAWCQELEEDAEEFLIETSVDLSDLMPIPDQGGTSDCIALVKIGKGRYKLYVRDLKYGKGVRVVAEDNTQGMLYAYGSWKILKDRFNIVEIEIGICHPRLKDGTTTFTITTEDLLDFAEYVKERAVEAWQFDAPRTPSDGGCQWCKIKGTCPALYLETAEVTSGAFDDDDEFVPRTYSVAEMDSASERLEDDFGPEPFRPHNPRQLSTAALAKILRYRKVTEQFFSAVEAELLERAISREEDIPGWKIVRGRANRKWPDNIAIPYRKLRALGLSDDALFTTEMISPAVAETKLKAKAGLTKDAAADIVNAIAVKPPGGKSLVRTSDKREALPSDADAFEDDDEFVPRKRRN